jgi:hypothetical protein
MTVFASEVRMFHTVCRTRQFFSVCRTTSFFGVFWTNLNQSTFHTLLFRVCLITELKFEIAHCLMIHLLIFFNPRRKFLWIEHCFHTWYMSLSRAPYLHFIWWKIQLQNTNYDAALCATCFVLFSLLLICQNYCPASFPHTFSIWILAIELQSAIYSSRWSVTSDTYTLDLSTYLRHQSFNL